jgi:hypothetical protein
MKILVACEYSGTVRDAFIAKGHDAVSCDLLPSDAPLNGPHYEGSVFDIINDGWDMLIGHPPCTYLTNSGVSWLHRRPERWAQLEDGAAFFKALWNAPIKRIGLENPIMHKYAIERTGAGKQSQVIQPWMFGHMEKKGTGLWLKNLPLLKATTNLLDETNKLPMKEQQRIHMLPPSADRWKLRSTTFKGIAAAMADQWGNL